MIGLICAFFIGKYFYKLAKDYDKNSLVYIVLGVFCFYLGSIILGDFILYYFIEFSNYSFSNFSFFGRGLLTMPFGIGVSCLVHYLLERKWKKLVILAKDEIQNIGKDIKEVN